MLVKVELETPIIQLKCIHCKELTEPFSQVCVLEIEKWRVPFLEDGHIHLDGSPTPIKKGDTVPSVCPKCLALGLPTPENWERVPFEWEGEDAELLLGS